MGGTENEEGTECDSAPAAIMDCNPTSTRRSSLSVVLSKTLLLSLLVCHMGLSPPEGGGDEQGGGSLMMFKAFLWRQLEWMEEPYIRILPVVQW